MLVMRELQRSDLPTVNSWRAGRSMVDCFGAPFRCIGPEVDEAWFDSYMKGHSGCVRCAVAGSVDPAVPLGLATLASINWVHRSCVFHIQVSPDAQGKGVGKFALDQMLHHAFMDLGLSRVELEVLDSNERPRHMYEKAGFSVEGRKRQAAFKNGSFVDMLVMGLLHDGWLGGSN